MQAPGGQQRGDVFKLFVGQIPKTLEEDGVREVFQDYGEIVEIVILRDRRTNMHQGCCFVKYSSMIAAQSAINALHNQRSLPPLRNPLQVRFAQNGVNSADRGQTNAENKLFVGGVPPGCGDKELRSLFGTYGEVLDVYILASKASQEGQRGCAFVRYATQQSCAMAIDALHGKYAMKAGELPLVVRYADPPKSQRGNGGYGQGGRFPPGWPQSPPVWPSGPPPMGWPGMGWGMPGGGMGMPGGYPPWAMPPMGGQPGVPNPYGYYGGQYSGSPSGPTGAPQPTQVPPAQQQYGNMGAVPPPPPPQMSGGGGGNPQPPLPPPAPAAPASHAWTEHATPDGLRYYYNASSGTSSWERPPELTSASRSQSVPPLPPLPAGGGAAAVATTAAAGSAGSGLEQSMELLSMGGGTNGAATQGGYMTSNGLGAMSGIANLSALSNTGAVDALAVGSGTAEQTSVIVQEWPAGVDLRNSFARFGTITSCESDAASGSARVTYDMGRSANSAVEMMNGMSVGDKTLHVSLGF